MCVVSLSVRTVRSLTFHSLRHSFNSAMANAGVSQEIRMKLIGHVSAEMNKGYFPKAWGEISTKRPVSHEPVSAMTYRATHC